MQLFYCKDTKNIGSIKSKYFEVPSKYEQTPDYNVLSKTQQNSLYSCNKT